MVNLSAQVFFEILSLLCKTWSCEHTSLNGFDIAILEVDHQDIIDTGIPQQTNIKGLNAQRQWYLFEQICPFCKSTLFADLSQVALSQQDIITSQ